MSDDELQGANADFVGDPAAVRGEQEQLDDGSESGQDWAIWLNLQASTSLGIHNIDEDMATIQKHESCSLHDTNTYNMKVEVNDLRKSIHMIVVIRIPEHKYVCYMYICYNLFTCWFASWRLQLGADSNEA